MLFLRLPLPLRSTARRDRSSLDDAARPARRHGSAADSALVSRHGQDLLVGLRHQV